jgi:D-methionine transport system substrate-binding protein
MWKINLVICSVILFCISSCKQSSSSKTLRVIASPTPHTEMLEACAPILKKQGIELEIITIADYLLPNRLVDEKQADANFFQHLPFLDYQKKEFSLACEVLGKIHLEPMGLYGKKIKNRQDFYDKTIAVPMDPSNEARALKLLEAEGMIKLDETFYDSIIHIKENPYRLKFVEIDAALLPRIFDDVDLAVIPTNFALQLSLNPSKDAILIESNDSPYANILVSHPQSNKKAELKALIDALKSEEMKAYIQQSFKGAIIPAK